MTYFIIWFIGFVITYIILKITKFLDKYEDPSWEDIRSKILTSLFWPITWVTFALIVIFLLINKIKPPKWL